MITVERILKLILVAFFLLLLILQFLSFPGQFRYMAEQEPENSQWRWPLTIWVLFIILAIEICVVSLWMIVNSLSQRGPLKAQLRWVNISIYSLVFIWISIFLAWVALISVADDPGLPVVVTVVLTAITALIVLTLFFRKLILQRIEPR